MSGKKLSSILVHDYCITVGIPKCILSDNATYFLTDKFTNPLQEKGINCITTSYYHPMGNPTERVNRELNRFFRAYCSNSHTSWYKHLPYIENCINSTYHSSTGVTSSEIMHNRRNTTFLEKIIHFPAPPRDADMTAVVQNKLKQSANHRKKTYDKHHVAPSYKVGQLVLLKLHKLSDGESNITHKFFHLYEGPFRIVNIFDNNTVELYDDKLDRPMGIQNVFNTRPYYSV